MEAVTETRGVLVYKANDGKIKKAVVGTYFIYERRDEVWVARVNSRGNSTHSVCRVGQVVDFIREVN